MQRLTKYSLLLKAIHKNTEDEEQRAELIIMVFIYFNNRQLIIVKNLLIYVYKEYEEGHYLFYL